MNSGIINKEVGQLNFESDPFRSFREANRKARKQDFEMEENEKERRRKNYDFIQYQRDSVELIIKMMDENKLAAKVFMFLTKFMDHKNAIVCSSKTLEDYFSCSRTTMYRSIKYLEDNYFLITANIGTARIFTMNPGVAWTTYADKKAFCEFDGKVLMNKSEGKDFIVKAKKFKEVHLKELSKNED